MLYGAADKQSDKYIKDINGHEIYNGETMFIKDRYTVLCRECFSFYLKKFDEEQLAELTGLAKVDICRPHRTLQEEYQCGENI